MKILGLIPARSGSKGVPDKNVRLLGGKPLMNWTIEAALASEAFEDIVVSTDSLAYAAIATKIGADVPFLRPSFLASDSAKSIDVIVHTITELEKAGLYYDAVCLLQVTTPFRSVELIKDCIYKYEMGGLDSLISVCKIPHKYHPNWAFVRLNTDKIIPAQGKDSVISRRQGLPSAYFRDGAVYITKTEVIKQGRLFGDQLGYLESMEELINIDTNQDWSMAEAHVRNTSDHNAK